MISPDQPGSPILQPRRKPSTRPAYGRPGNSTVTSSVGSPCAVCGVPAQKKPLLRARSTCSGSSVSTASTGRETVVAVGRASTGPRRTWTGPPPWRRASRPPRPVVRVSSRWTRSGCAARTVTSGRPRRLSRGHRPDFRVRKIAPSPSAGSIKATEFRRRGKVTPSSSKSPVSCTS